MSGSLLLQWAAVAFVCSNVQGQLVETKMSCYWDESSVNAHHENHFVVARRHFLAGSISSFNKSREDRGFQWKYCTPESLGAGASPYESIERLDETSTDDKWERECPERSALIGAFSEYKDDKGDRKWTWFCGNLVPEFKLVNCVKTLEYVNTWEETVQFECPGNGVLNGVISKHDDDDEDRKWGFRCCSVAPAAVPVVAH